MIARRIIGIVLALFGIYILLDSFAYDSFNMFTVILVLLFMLIGGALLNYDTAKAKEQRAIKQKEEEDKKNDKKSVFKTTD